MLRNVSSGAAVRRLARRLPDAVNIPGRQSTRRTFATSDKKRALNVQQLKESKASEPAKSGIPPPEAAVETEAKSGGAGLMMPLLLATGGVGAAYYGGFLDGQLGDKYKSTAILGGEQPEAPKPVAVEKKPEPAPVVAPKKVDKPEKKKKTTVESTSKTADESLAKVAKEEVAIAKKEIEEFNEIIADVISEASLEVEGVQEAVEAIAEEEKKNAAKAAKMAEKAAKKKKKKEEPAPVEEPAPIVMGSAAIATSTLDESKIMAEIQELKNQLNQRTDSALKEAHTELAKVGSMDVMGLDLDKMTPSQLKVRLVQMARDLEERTKWEAVRLQEFLTMKEKEVEDKYVLLIKKLRIEAEQLQEGKLAEQKKSLVVQAEEVLKEHQTRSDAFLENSMQIQEKAHAEDKAAFEQKTKEAMEAKYEELLGKELAKIKEEFAAKMSQRVRQMEELTKKLSDLEISLKTSKDFQRGSVEAHRITAAAIALMEKLDSGDPAGAAVRALGAVASDNAVVTAAIDSLPASVSLSGVSTLQELQTSFDETIYPQCRKAANVPPGVDGLEGQLMGSVFSLLRFAPGPQEAAPEAEKDASEYVLARIKRYVQLGELEQAITEAKKLDGQVAFTAKDWTSQATDRVAVEKALKVIRMECALANETLTQATAAQ
mmetsp:Transcript_802/g.1895  ORF Transcript_802/g.1895 Transcript_802/m.1895 type:complete len:659 (-) Transcript_802:49-2025(-)